MDWHRRQVKPAQWAPGRPCQLAAPPVALGRPRCTVRSRGASSAADWPRAAALSSEQPSYRPCGGHGLHLLPSARSPRQPPVRNLPLATGRRRQPPRRAPASSAPPPPTPPWSARRHPSRRSRPWRARRGPGRQPARRPPPQPPVRRTHRADPPRSQGPPAPGSRSAPRANPRPPSCPRARRPWARPPRCCSPPALTIQQPGGPRPLPWHAAHARSRRTSSG
mmetsp:Transcript_103058/g.327623  ORF Transcript_103058/g.327623 Transcript_103058/m.327623 type:complete len:222 (-) Transcript_103058:284-949(-)